MTAAAPMTLPGGKALVGWWRDCAAWSPRRLWFAHLILHRVEALVEVDQPGPLAGLARAALAFLARQQGALSPAALAAGLDLELTLVATLLGRLREGGLVEFAGSDSAARPTPAGREFLQGRPAGRQERRSFYFTDTRPPVYLPLTPQAALPLPPPGGWRFDLGALEACLARPAEWKRRHGFPAEVVRLIWSKGSVDARTWREVPLDRPEQVYLLLVEVAYGTVLGLSVQPGGWELVREPAVRLPAGAEVVESLAGEAGADAWRQAWLAWCQQRSLPAGEVEACKLEPAGHRLVVKAPGRLVERLRHAKSEALRGEAWLLAGTGRVRPAALIEVGQ
jgi:hypothetical protein